MLEDRHNAVAGFTNDGIGTVSATAKQGDTIIFSGNLPARLVPGCEITLTITPNAGYRFISFTVNDGAVEYVENSDGTYSFAMPAEAVNVSVEVVPLFEVEGENIITLPEDLTAIEENAFEGATSLKVVDAHSCAAIGKDVFRDASLEKIRLPQDCAIDPAAFGEQRIFVFAPAGGTTEAYCARYENLIFIAE